MLTSFLSLEVPEQMIVRFLVLLVYLQLKTHIAEQLFVDRSRGQHQQQSLSPPERRLVEPLPAGDPSHLPCPLPSSPHHQFFANPASSTHVGRYSMNPLSRLVWSANRRITVSTTSDSQKCCPASFLLCTYLFINSMNSWYVSGLEVMNCCLTVPM